MPADSFTGQKAGLPDAAFQAHFHQRWGHLLDHHVRDLAWLIDAPLLLDPAAPQWEGKIAALPPDEGERRADWLAALDRAPERLRERLGIGPFTRLGRYAESLLAFYFQETGLLAAYSVQVKEDKNITVGEFDFLLHPFGGRNGVGNDAGLLHWELATKFYLLAPDSDTARADYFVGPNLADTLQAKMRKILHRQLALAQHPAAAAVLPGAVYGAQAFVKGWLFYPAAHNIDLPAAGINAAHCRGFWRPRAALPLADGARYLILPRLKWLAPTQVPAESTLDAAQLVARIDSHFAAEARPLMVALMAVEGALARETARGFVVPDNWQDHARRRMAAAIG